MSNNDLETLFAKTIRTLCMDAIRAADSGRPGTLLAYDTQRTVAAAKAPHARAARRNLFIEIPGTPEGLPEIEEAIASGVPVSGVSSSAACLLSRSSRSSRARRTPNSDTTRPRTR
ncbi:Transaldolase [Actinobacteria bacterium OK006]|nr:Transaldolase [Actinobacteria bacterium OK006]